jgi:glycosyltransferase involved in cell wall biosynthesis
MNSKKTFLIINQTAGSPYHGMVYRNYYIAREWVKQGHRAIIISGSYFHNFGQLPHTTGLFTKEMIDGIEYWWVKLPQYSHSRSFGRLFTLFIFPFLLLFFPFWKLLKPETVIVSGPPHLSIFNAWIWARIWGATLVYEVRDIWPLTIVKLGNVSPWNPMIIFLSFFERLAYMASDRVVSVLSRAYNHFEVKGMLPSKFAFIPNGIDLSDYSIKENEVGNRIAEISNKKFTLIYAGSFGIANHLDQLLEVADSLKNHNDIAFVLIGDGPHKKNLIEKAKDNPNVYFFPLVQKDQIPYILYQAHVGFIGFTKTDLYQFGVSPNKIFDYMAAKLPILMVLDSEDDIIERAQAGKNVRSGKTEDITNALLSLKELKPDQLKELGHNGRKYLEEHHVYESLAEKYVKVAEEGRRPKEESARWIASPFWIGFWLVMIMGSIAYFILPALFPHLFENGITTFLLDPHFYHSLAIEASSLPWSEFTFRPKGQFPAGILGLIYKITGISKPYMLLPILALMAGFTIRIITSCLDVLGVRGRWWPLLIGIILNVRPTSISWMIYPHKDAFIVPGVLLLAWTLMAVTLRRIRLKHFVSLLLGSFLVFSSKPYFAEIFFLGTLLAIPFAWRQPASKLGRYGRIAFFAMGLMLFASISIWEKGYSAAGESRPTKKGIVKENLPRHVDTRNNWESIPGGKFVNKPLMALAYTRERFLFERADANTNYYPDIHLKGGWETIQYFPKALKLSFLEPLPFKSNEGSGAKRLLFASVQIEMLLVYAALLFLIFSGRGTWSPAVLVCIVLALPFLISFGVAVPNVGTINRYRFPFLILIKLAGLAALWNASRLKWPGRLLMWIDPPKLNRAKKKVLFLVPDDITFVIQRLAMAQGVQKAGYDVHVACPDLGHAQKIRDLGFTFHNVELNRGGLNPIADFFSFIKLIFFLAKERPDILQCVSIKPVIYGATAGTIVGLKRIVCLVNGLGFAFKGEGAKGKLFLFIAKALYRNALALPGVRVIFQNPDDQKFFIENKLVDADKTLLIRGSGVDMEKFKPAPQPNNPKPAVLYVGRLLWSKGIEDLIEAIRMLREDKIDFTFKVVGAPDEKNPEAIPLEYLQELHDKGFVEWVGRQNDMPGFYIEADIVVLPQRNREGLPLTLAEAASTGRALITTDVPGCREVVRNNVNGFLVGPNRPQELALALKELILNPTLRKQFGEAGSEIVKNEFSTIIVQKQLTGVYKSLLENDLVPKTINSLDFSYLNR